MTPPSSNPQEMLQCEHKLATVQRVSEALFHKIELDQLVETALSSAMDEVDAEAGSVLLSFPETKQLVFHHSIGEKPVPRGTAIPWDKGISGKVFQSGDACITAQIDGTTGHYALIDELTQFRTRMMLTVPLRRWTGESIGVLNLLNKRHGTFDEHDLALASIVSAFAALAIQQAKNFDDAQKAEVVTLLGDIGHDMKNMLQPVLAGMELLKEEVDSLFKDMTATELNRKKESQNLCDEATGMVQRGINRLHERVRELADCIKGLSSPPTFAPCDLAAVIHEVFGTLKVLATEKELSLLTEGLSSLPKLIADEKRLYNAFYNLINNAIPETPPGGSITVGGRLDTELGGIAVWVKDTGRGITKEVLKNLFSARVVSTKRGGTGLGTKIIKDVVDAHHGNICVESTVGVGSTFYIRLPIDPTQVDFRSQTRLP